MLEYDSNRITGGQFVLAKLALGMTLGQIGVLIGVSERTAQRISNGQSVVGPHIHEKLVRAVLAKDPQLGKQLAAHIGLSLEVSPAGPSVPARPPLPLSVALDSLVCAAAEASQLAPGQVRPAVHAAFARAAQLSLSVNDVLTLLAPPAPPPEAKPATSSKRSAR